MSGKVTGELDRCLVDARCADVWVLLLELVPRLQDAAPAASALRAEHLLSLKQPQVRRAIARRETGDLETERVQLGDVSCRGGLEFLFSRNRLNVAISRAQCLAVLVGSPRLLDVRTRSVDQMRLVKALCRFVEVTEEQASA